MESLTVEAAVAVEQAELLIGADRLLAPWQGTKPCLEAVRAQDIAAAIENHSEKEICVLFSGDSGFYSGARLLLPLLREEPALLPGVSSLQLFAARLKEPWQSWRLCSAHGVSCDPVYAVCGGAPCSSSPGARPAPRPSAES